MKKRLFSLSLALSLTLGLCGITAPKAEAVGPIVESNVPIKYVAIPSSSLIAPYTVGQDGMFPCFDLSGGGGLNTVYVGLDGYVIRPAGAVDFQYSEGLVAVVNSQNKVGYADNLGNLVIPYQFDVCLKDGDPFTGEFQNGTCPVYVKTGEAPGIDWDAHLRDGNTSASYTWKGKSTQGYWQTIDRSGKVVSSDYNVVQVWDRRHAYCLDFEAGQEAGRVTRENPSKYPANVKITVNGVEYDAIYDSRTGHGYAGDPNLSGDHLLSDIRSFTSYGIVFVAEEVGSSQTGNSGSALDSTGNNMGDANATYGQADFRPLGYTITDYDAGIAYLVIEVSNPTEYKDEGDLFYLVYNKYYPSETGVWRNSEDFLPSGEIFQIHYSIGPGETQTHWIPVQETANWDGQTPKVRAGFRDMDPSFREITTVADSRMVMVQAETQEECAELVEFFKRCHTYTENQLSYRRNAIGVTLLAQVMSTQSYRDFLDEKLAYYTSQF